MRAALSLSRDQHATPIAVVIIANMEIKILNHARQRMQRYNVEHAIVEETLKNPDSEVEGYAGRRIAQKKLNGYVLRVVYEKQNHKRIVVTVYKARRERYEI